MKLAYIITYKRLEESPRDFETCVGVFIPGSRDLSSFLSRSLISPSTRLLLDAFYSIEVPRALSNDLLLPSHCGK